MYHTEIPLLQKCLPSDVQGTLPTVVVIIDILEARFDYFRKWIFLLFCSIPILLRCYHVDVNRILANRIKEKNEIGCNTNNWKGLEIIALCFVSCKCKDEADSFFQSIVYV